MTAAPILTRRQLNRALLARQHLLRREKRGVAETLEWLVGVQAQTPISPYVALWSRLDGFDPGELAALLLDRRAVRIHLMRCTIHLVTADDCVALRPPFQPVQERGFASGSPFGRRLAGIDLGALLAEGRALLEERPRTTAELRTLLGASWPGYDRDALAYACGYLLPLVQIPPRAVWGRTGLPLHATAEAWLGRPLSPDTAPDAAVLRYLAAFGPASIADIRIWSWLTDVREVIERLRPGLRTFRDELGRELFDVPNGLLPDPDGPAPPRFLPDFDNAVLSHADRTRIVPVNVRQTASWNWGALLVDGFVAGTWKLLREKRAATLRIRTFDVLSGRDVDDVTGEGARLLAFMAPDAGPGQVTIAKHDERSEDRADDYR
jgi:hypothetical protein